MKIHITNLYGFGGRDELVDMQHKFANAGHSLGFYEMGVFRYPVETDDPGELSKRLDGVIASLEAEDFVFVQLPTQNGFAYEQLLLQKIRAYKHTKIGLILHGASFAGKASADAMERYEALCAMADVVVIPDRCSDTSVLKYLMDAVEEVYAPQVKSIRKTINAYEDEIHIGFGLHDKTGNYSVWVGVAMQSIIEHTSSAICFHILHDETLNNENREKLKQVALTGGHRVCFLFLDCQMFAGVTAQLEVFTIGAMFRIMLPELLPDLPRIIYLDADILVNRDIRELWDIDISEYYMGAVSDVDVAKGLARPLPVKRGEVSAERYFNSGVLYINLDKIRKKGNMRWSILEYLKGAKQAMLPDQDALNALYHEETLLLDVSWNYFAMFVRRDGEQELKHRIYHYAATRCVLYSMTAMDRLYYDTIMRTPWATEECRRQLNLAFDRTDDRIEQLEKVIGLLCNSQKKRVFYGSETLSMRNMYSLLTLREEDYRVLSNPVSEYDSILECKDFSVLKAEKEPFIVFVLPEADGGRAIANLEQLGLQNGKDFFVIPRLLSPVKGGYM